MESKIQKMTIGKLAKAAEVGVETIRFYERTGLLKQPKAQGSFREYTTEDIKRIRFVKKTKELGFTLEEIKEILELNSSTKATCSDVKKKADSKLSEVEQKIKDLQKMKKSLKELSEACGDSKQALAQCQILNCFESGWKC